MRLNSHALAQAVSQPASVCCCTAALPGLWSCCPFVRSHHASSHGLGAQIQSICCTAAGADRDDLADARNAALAYRAKEIKHLQNYIVLCTDYELRCEATVHKAENQIAQLTERLEHEEAKLADHAATLTEVQVRRSAPPMRNPVLHCGCMSMHSSCMSGYLLSATGNGNCTALGHIQSHRMRRRSNAIARRSQRVHFLYMAQ